MNIYLKTNDIKEILNNYISNLYNVDDVQLSFGISKLIVAPFYQCHAAYVINNKISINGKEYISKEVVSINDEMILLYLITIFRESGYVYKSSSYNFDGIRFELEKKEPHKKLVL